MEQPRVFGDRATVQAMSDGLTHVTVRYGFFETPDVPAALHVLETCGELEERKNAVYFGTRDVVLIDKHSVLGRWRAYVFAVLYKNATRLIDRFNLPPERTVEISRLIKL
jgi:KUP system potassium uptake protein